MANPVGFEIVKRNEGYYDLIAVFQNGDRYSWSKEIKTERGAKAKRTEWMKRFNIEVTE